MYNGSYNVRPATCATSFLIFNNNAQINDKIIAFCLEFHIEYLIYTDFQLHNTTLHLVF